MHGTLKTTTAHRSATLTLLLALLLALAGSLSLAQETGARSLTPGTTLHGTLDAENLAQVYTFEGTAGQTVTVKATTGPGVALLLTDSEGEPLARAAAAPDSEPGSMETPAVTLAVTGRYYVTLFAFSDAFNEALGAFDLTLSAGEGAEAETTPEVTPPQAGQIVTTSGMQVKVTWNSTADLNLEVRDPLGGTLHWDSRTAENGGTFGFDANGLCEVLTSTPSEVATWPGGALATGGYEVLVFYRQSCQNEGPVAFSVDVVLDGNELPPIVGTLPFASADQVFVSSFVVGEDGSAVVGKSGIYDALTATPKNVPAPADARPISVGEALRGAISSNQTLEAFTFTGEANQIVSVAMTRTTGSLDSLLYLLGPNGNVISSNDDVEFGVRDSALQNLRLPVSGQFTIVATRYGQELGGTVGNYTLTLSGPTSDIPPEVLALNLPQGDIEVTLLWNTRADLQLLVRDPSLNSVFDDTPTVPSGGRLVAAGNVNCTQTQTQPVSYIYWPRGFLRAGTYEVDVWFQNECGDARPVEFTLIVSVDGEVVFIDSARPLPDDQYVSAFTIDVDRTVSVRGGGIMNLTAIDYAAELDSAPVMESGQPLTGNLSFDNPFDVFVYDGAAGDLVNVNMRATGGNLDTLLYVLDPAGNLLRSNDDATPGEVTNSLIDDLSLGEDGRYIIIATRFGILYGATTGTYELSVTRRS